MFFFHRKRWFVILLNSTKTYWDKDSFLDIFYENGVYIGRYTHTKYARTEYKFLPAPVLVPGSTWKHNDVQMPNWYASNFNDNSWSISSSFPSFTSGVTTRYYRKTLTFGDLTGYAAFEVAVYARYGVAIYVNGEEIYRYNLPASTLSSTTPCSSSDNTYEYRRAFASRRLLTSSTVIAIEVHNPSGFTGDDEFNAFVALVYSNTHRTWDGTVDGTHIYDYQTEYGTNFWLNKIQLKWYINPSANGKAINTYTFNNGRAEFVNMYKLSTGNYDVGRRPKSWKVYGSNDGVNWDLLDYQRNVPFDGYGHTKVFLMSQVRKGYRKLRFENLAHNGSNDGENAGDRKSVV